MDQITEYLNVLLVVGDLVEKSILNLSVTVASEGAAGFVSACIGLLLLWLMIIYYVHFSKRQNEVKKLTKIISTAMDEVDFKEKYDDINSDIKAAFTNSQTVAINRAWNEYCETVLISEDNDVIRNTTRPSSFFNPYELGFESGLGRQWVNIFVTIGLFFTFLGIIAALTELISASGQGESLAFSNRNMEAFLDAAKSKFIMSLSGLGASIVFNFWFRHLSGKGDAAVDVFCSTLETRVIFQTPEQIAERQLEAVKAQTEQLQAMGNNLGAQIGTTVGEAVAQKLEPVLQKIGNSAGTEVEGLVGQLGDTIYEKLNASLDEVSATLNGVNSSLTDISRQLQTSSSNVGEEMTNAVQSLSDLMSSARQKAMDDEQSARNERDNQLESSKIEMDNFLKLIEENTRKGSEQLVDAATKISNAAENLKDALGNAANNIGDEASQAVQGIGQGAVSSIGEAGEKVSESISAATENVLANVREFTESLQGLLGDPVETFAKELQSANRELKNHSSEIIKASNTQATAASQLEASSKSLGTVANPISTSISQIQTINSAIAQSLEANREILEGTSSQVKATMEALNLSIKELNAIVTTTDNLDEKLGDAFKAISVGLNDTQTEVKEFTDQVHGKFTEATNALQNALDGLEEYKPN
jgi:ABC-type transporter Mla subunit MlaD